MANVEVTLAKQIKLTTPPAGMSSRLLLPGTKVTVDAAEATRMDQVDEVEAIP